ncbi:uncharacterized protein V6R79_021678 [Siganus canaliculatus]
MSTLEDSELYRTEDLHKTHSGFIGTSEDSTSVPCQKTKQRRRLEKEKEGIRGGEKDDSYL